MTNKQKKRLDTITKKIDKLAADVVSPEEEEKLYKANAILCDLLEPIH